MTLVHAVYVGGMRTMNKTTWKRIDIGSLCVHCGKDTAFGHSDMLFVDRIPCDTDLLNDDGNDYELNFVLKQETEWELGTIYKAQKAMDYIIEAINIGEW